jgi:hypothetical protein
VWKRLAAILDEWKYGLPGVDVRADSDCEEKVSYYIMQ